MVLPVPSLLSSIEEMLKRVHTLEGLILVADGATVTFVSISQLSSLLQRLRTHPKGELVAEMLYNSLQDAPSQGTIKPVLVLQDNGEFWLGLVGLRDSSLANIARVDHLNRCFYQSD